MTYKLPVASHSFLSAWENCPWKAFRQYIAKDLPRQPQTEAMKWGNEVHSAFEVRINHGTAFPKGMEKFEAVVAPLVKHGAEAERMAGIAADGVPCDFFASAVWLRGKLDCVLSHGSDAILFDWKTGKRREEAAELRIHAVLLKALHPTLQKITAHYVWLQDGEVGKPHDVSDTETTLAGIRKTMETVQNCIDEENFPKRPNPLCGGQWGSCPVEDCEHRRVPSR